MAPGLYHQERFNIMMQIQYQGEEIVSPAANGGKPP